MCTCYLKVHITEEVLKALNINHCHPTVALCDKTAWDTCNRSLNRNTCVHKSKSWTADWTLWSWTVWRKNFRNKAKCIREFFYRRNYRNESSFCKSTVTDFSSSWTSRWSNFTYRVRWEVVVVHISLFCFTVNAVKKLFVGNRTECCDCEDLSLSSCEHTRTVNSRNYANLWCERTDIVHSSAVNTLLLIE